MLKLETNEILYFQVTYSIPDLTAENIISVDEAEFIGLFKGTDDILTSAIASIVS